MDWVEIALYGILGFLGVATAIIISVIFIMLFKYNITFIAKKVVNGRKIYYFTKAKEVMDQDGQHYWRLLNKGGVKFKEFPAPVPAEDVIEIDNRGKQVVEAYLTSTNEWVYSKDIYQAISVPEEILNPVPPKEIMLMPDSPEKDQKINEWKEQCKEELKAWKKTNYIIASKEPVTTNQRNLIIDQIDKAKRDAGFVWKEHMPLIIGGAVLIIILAIVMIFWGEVMAPMEVVADKFENAAEVMKMCQTVT